jgi:hypothetical protein
LLIQAHFLLNKSGATPAASQPREAEFHKFVLVSWHRPVGKTAEIGPFAL